mmetsp:Transcript_11934/g.16500  ORF Transcript_11934/g.16500 Transcript_11934/m.16500 type:complete len:85 (-) Transcript_11934:395-649(-)
MKQSFPTDNIFYLFKKYTIYPSHRLECGRSVMATFRVFVCPSFFGAVTTNTPSARFAEILFVSTLVGSIVKLLSNFDSVIVSPL